MSQKPLAVSWAKAQTKDHKSQQKNGKRSSTSSNNNNNNNPQQQQQQHKTPSSPPSTSLSASNSNNNPNIDTLSISPPTNSQRSNDPSILRLDSIDPHTQTGSSS
jgi:hypothetical protein